MGESAALECLRAVRGVVGISFRILWCIVTNRMFVSYVVWNIVIRLDCSAGSSLFH